MQTVLHIVLNNFKNDSRVLREVKTLADGGFSVKVLALHEEGLPREETDSLYFLKRVRLVTRPLPKGFLWQSLKYLECFLKMVFIGIRIKPQIVHSHDRNALPIGYVVSVLTRSKLVYDSHELWGHTSHAAKRPAFFGKLAAKMERHVMSKAARVITVSDSIAQCLREATQPGDKVVVIRNMPYRVLPTDKTPASPALRESLGIPPGKKVILYQGVVSPFRGLENLVKSARYLDKEAAIVILGSGILIPELRKIADTLPKGSIFLHPAVSPDQLARYTADADIGISLTADVSLNNRYSLPNKLFEYIQAGLPVAVSNLPEMAKFVTENKVGVVLCELDSESIALALNNLLRNKKMLDEFKKNCEEIAPFFCWEVEQKKLLKIYNGLISARD